MNNILKNKTVRIILKIALTIFLLPVTNYIIAVLIALTGSKIFGIFGVIYIVAIVKIWQYKPD